MYVSKKWRGIDSATVTPWAEEKFAFQGVNHPRCAFSTSLSYVAFFEAMAEEKKTEVEETRSAVQHASLYLVFLPRKSPSNRSLYGCINYFFPPDFRYNSAKNPCPLDRGVIQPWVWYSSPALNPSFERCIRLDTQRTQELILSIWMIFKHWFVKCDEKTSDEIRYLLNIRYFKYNFQLICEISVLKRGQMIFISKQW